MTDTEKNWREAKPKWVVEAAEKEMAAMKRRLALRWPEEARPVPLPFHWGDYDRLTGVPEEGDYFIVSGYGTAASLSIKRNSGEVDTHRGWIFNWGCQRWSDTAYRGPLYATKREAQLAALWKACDKAAADLEKAWRPILENPPKGA